MSGRLENKVAIVLGASSPDNIGQAIAMRFLEEGARVVVSGRKRETLERFATERGCEFTTCDITKQHEIDQLIAFTKSTYGGVDVGVNAVGWGLVTPFLETTPDQIDRMCALQFRGPFQFFQALIRAMEKGGSIIQISTATATVLFEDHAAYMGTKAGIDHVVRCVANEFGARGIRANSISPGVTASPMTDAFVKTPGVVAAFEREYPLGRIGTSQDVAEAAVWLASDDCFMTGQNLQVNGGLTLRRNPRLQELQAAIAAARAGTSGGDR